jgi:hypothetical protein
MRDLKPEFLDRGMATITKSLDRLVSHQRLMPEQRVSALSRIRPTTELKELAPSEIIVEAILEDYELKASVIRELDAGNAGPSLRGHKEWSGFHRSHNDCMSISGLARAAYPVLDADGGCLAAR